MLWHYKVTAAIFIKNTLFAADIQDEANKEKITIFIVYVFLSVEKYNFGFAFVYPLFAANRFIGIVYIYKQVGSKIRSNIWDLILVQACLKNENH